MVQPLRGTRIEPAVRQSGRRLEGACGAAGQSGTGDGHPGWGVHPQGERRAGANEGRDACGAADESGLLQAGGS